MIGIIDVGGGMKAIYSAGILDYCLDNEIYFDYALGVSAGSGNLGTYTARQRGRNYIFYTDYTFRKEYMSTRNFLKNGEYCNLDYPYSVLSNEGGENPLDYDILEISSTDLNVVATEAASGKPEYFNQKDMSRNDYWLFKASSTIPIVSKPFEREGKRYYDGGIADPIPVKKAFEDGCDKVVIVLSRPKNFRKYLRKSDKLSKVFLKKYPKMIEAIYNRADKYNKILEELLEGELYKNKVLVLGPSDNFGVDTLSKKKEELDKLYQMGYEDGEKIKQFIY
ncbi:patatin-like phospholipase family protein [Miniphocaeibacter massiliensis]|uniref:patatin-like phospholipase family protein n=1 Tax=Miniphocaeibacter massiliensis TaxID=2041841 RepID=UPI000C1BA52D|nr:patatin family protein [Miniphocaeibacter massiliensis]